MKYVYASRSGNVEELVHVLGLEAMKIKDSTETIDQDFILFTYNEVYAFRPVKDTKGSIAETILPLL